ncbi:MAG: hypothetical protein AAGG07_03195 [Planctomycetota bacterium]
MHGLRRLAEVIHGTLLGVWLGAVLMTGIAAAIIFPTVKELSPTVSTLAAYDGEHWRIVAGRVANTVFLYSDTVQFVCATGGLASLIAVLIASGSGWRRITLGLRTVGFAVALSLFSYSFFILRTKMNGELIAYWSSAEAGENAIAAAHRQAFAEMHPTASTLIGATAFAVLFTLVTGLFDATRRSIPGSEPTTPQPVRGGYEEPALGRGRPR